MPHSVMRPSGAVVVALLPDETDELIQLSATVNELADAWKAAQTAFLLRLNQLRVKYKTDPGREEYLARPNPEYEMHLVGGMGYPSELSYDFKFLVRK